MKTIISLIIFGVFALNASASENLKGFTFDCETKEAYKAWLVQNPDETAAQFFFSAFVEENCGVKYEDIKVEGN